MTVRSEMVYDVCVGCVALAVVCARLRPGGVYRGGRGAVVRSVSLCVCVRLYGFTDYV